MPLEGGSSLSSHPEVEGVHYTFSGVLVPRALIAPPVRRIHDKVKINVKIHIVPQQCVKQLISIIRRPLLRHANQPLELMFMPRFLWTGPKYHRKASITHNSYRGFSLIKKIIEEVVVSDSASTMTNNALSAARGRGSTPVLTRPALILRV